MFRNYLKSAWRNLKRNKFFSLINIIGFAVGLTCFLLICAYLYTQVTYDRYARNADRIYRVELEAHDVHYPYVDGPVGKGIKDAFPGVMSYTRMVNQPEHFVSYGQNKFKEDRTAGADANFLQFFSIPLLKGDIKTALAQPYSIVITKEMAQKYFGRNDPIGKTLIFDDKATYQVTGVIDKLPVRSHFHFDAFISMSSFPWRMNVTTWSNLGYYTYIVLRKGVDPQKLEAKFTQLVAQHVAPEIEKGIESIKNISQRQYEKAEARKSINSFSFSLMPLTRIHLYSHTKYEIEPNGDIKYVHIFASLALFILLLACVNFINLSTAASFRRVKEVGIRKTLGSVRGQLIGQFLTESALVTCFATLVALILVPVLWPFFNHLTGNNMLLSTLISGRSLAFILLLMLVVGIVSGVYPAFFLSSFRPASILKGNFSLSNGNKGKIRGGLVVFQFIISGCLIIATLVIYQQLNFMQHKKLGFDKNQALVIQDTNKLGHDEEAFRQQLLQDPMVVDATISRDVPGRKESDLGRTMAYPSDQSQNKTSARSPIHIFYVDDRYIPTLEINMVQGRNFSPDFPSDSSATVINQEAVKAMGWSHSDPIGKYIVVSNGTKYKVIGVVNDFNYLSVQEQVAPLMMMLGRNKGGMMVKVKTADIPRLLSKIEKEWISFHPSAAFSYDFVDSRLAALYVSEKRVGQLFLAFTLMAIIITCLGLFGLVTFMTNQRTKEIGIRKVLGASVGNVLKIISVDFIRLVLIAIVIATPIAWLAMNKWLQNFAYRINMSWWIFVVAGFLAIIIALLTVSWQAIRAARANPVKSLRTE